MTANIRLFHCINAGDGTSFRPWHIDDISKDGARLRVAGADGVPERFTLLVKGNVQKLLRCQVVWRSASHVGVKFEQSATPERDSA